MRWLLAASVGVALLGWAGRARAEDVRVVVVGDDRAATDLGARAAAARLRALGHAVRPVPKGDPLARSFLACARQAETACKLTPTDGTAFALVLEVKVAAGGAARRVDVTGWLLEGSGGARLASDQGACEACDSARVTELVVGLAERLVREGRARMGTTRLAFTSVPVGATVELDGEIIGVTDTEYTTYPGAHRVRFTLDGHADAVREIVAHANARTAIAVTLVRAGGAGATSPIAPAGATTAQGPARPARLRGWLATGTGLALAVAGGVLIAFDEDELEGGVRKDGYRDTALLGVGAVAAGVLVGGLGGYWLWADTSGREPATGTQAVVGLGGRF